MVASSGKIPQPLISPERSNRSYFIPSVGSVKRLWLCSLTHPAREDSMKNDIGGFIADQLGLRCQKRQRTDDGTQRWVFTSNSDKRTIKVVCQHPDGFPHWAIWVLEKGKNPEFVGLYDNGRMAFADVLKIFDFTG